MTTMLEAATIAACEAAGTVPPHQQGTREGWSVVARAVLLAVREPARVHAEAAGVPLKQFGSWGYDSVHDRQREFGAIIDAILNEGETNGR